MALLLARFAAPRRQQENAAEWRVNRDFLMREYQFEYGYLHQPYQSGRVRAEVLHPVFVDRQAPSTLRIGHATDTHVSTHLDVYERNLQHSNFRNLHFNNWNRSFAAVYERAKTNTDVVLLTGDLIDYGRGHWGLNRADRLGDDGSYHVDRNWFLFYHLLASRRRLYPPGLHHPRQPRLAAESVYAVRGGRRAGAVGVLPRHAAAAQRPGT